MPVLKNADQLSLMGLTTGANELAEKARTKTLGFDDIQGGTFTITNVGAIGTSAERPEGGAADRACRTTARISSGVKAFGSVE